jgi:hypothetical protein
MAPRGSSVRSDHVWQLDFVNTLKFNLNQSCSAGQLKRSVPGSMAFMYKTISHRIPQNAYTHRKVALWTMDKWRFYIITLIFFPPLPFFLVVLISCAYFNILLSYATDDVACKKSIVPLHTSRRLSSPSSSSSLPNISLVV